MASVRPTPLYFFDTSVLLGGLIELAGPQAPAQSLCDAVAEGRLARPGTAWHCCLEFYSVSTRLPEEYRLTPDQARQLVEEILARFRVHELPAKTRRHFVRTTAADGIAGGRLYDAHIAEVARASGAHIVVTENARHFSPLLRHGLSVLTAAEALSGLR